MIARAVSAALDRSDDAGATGWRHLSRLVATASQFVLRI